VKDWDTFYKQNDEAPVDLMIRLTSLRERKRFKDVEYALKAYLKYRGKNATANMYELLAVAIALNGKKEGKDVRGEIASALAWAALLAKRGEDPKQMTHVADLLNVHGYTEIAAVDARGNKYRTTIGELLDQATSKRPDWAEPLVMLFSLALKQKDADRYAATAEKMLALGWPDVDETWRAEIRRKAEGLAKTLREEGHADEADMLLKRVTAAEARDLVLRLSWKGDAGLDLVVEEPLGAKASVLTPRTVFGGAVVRSGRGKSPESVYVCPRAFDGDYKVRVETFYNDEKNPVREATLEIITHEGTPQEKIETRTIGVYKPAPAVVHLAGGHRTEVLPFQAPPVLRIVRDPAKASNTAEAPAAPKPPNTNPAEKTAAKPKK
jgi:hypothetical protein